LWLVMIPTLVDGLSGQAAMPTLSIGEQADAPGVQTVPIDHVRFALDGSDR
jgi:hypothetical protein